MAAGLASSIGKCLYWLTRNDVTEFFSFCSYPDKQVNIMFLPARGSLSSIPKPCDCTHSRWISLQNEWEQNISQWNTRHLHLNINMAANTKMVIITSNEDLMRHFSLHKVANTHIIDLDNAKREASTEADQNDTVNLASLAELSENVCILFRSSLIQISRWSYFRILALITSTNVHLIHLSVIHRWKY